MPNQYNYMCKIPNNEEGELFLALLKKYLNKDSYGIVRRGRNPNRQLAEDEGLYERFKNPFQRSVSIKYATEFNIYLLAKMEQETTVTGITTEIAYRQMRDELYELKWKPEGLEIDEVPAGKKHPFGMPRYMKVNKYE